MSEPLTLLPIADGEAMDTLLLIYAGTRAHEMQMVDWPVEQKAAFVTQQFNAQHTYYRHQVYPDADYYLVQRAGATLGRLYIERRLIPDTIRIIDIALLPEYRNQGIGAQIIQEVQNEARAAGKSVSIHVEKFNPAQNLYQRLGFKALHETHGIYLYMEWQPEPSAATSA
jgi:ribosomal protein S18 acetylase RimI-like enzyme